ncbi:3'-5' exonuclease [Candidatus Woesearchaeota archaeon]|nr:3'-5' exonuclease [Candidatus Woesearchaeota archaeon]
MIVVDIETTGLDPYRHCLLSVGAVDFCNPENFFYEECRIDDGAAVALDALMVNGFSEQQIRDVSKQSVRQLLEKFVKWSEECEERTLAGECVGFDHNFLKVTMERQGLYWFFGHRLIDLHSISQAHMRRRGLRPALKNSISGLNLDRTLGYVGLPGLPKPHHALTDAKMEAEAFSRLMHGKGLLKEFSHIGIPEYLR